MRTNDLPFVFLLGWRTNLERYTESQAIKHLPSKTQSRSSSRTSKAPRARFELFPGPCRRVLLLRLFRHLLREGGVMLRQGKVLLLRLAFHH